MSSIVAYGSSRAAAPCSACGLRHPAGTVCPLADRLAVRSAGEAIVPGTILAGRYQIRAVTHRSRMSTLYRATDLRRHYAAVAVKQFSGSLLSKDEQAESLRWLAREAGMLSSLQNLHLPALLAAFNEDGNQYVVMPYLEGETIKELVERSGPLQERTVTAWARILAGVLAYLHEQTPPIIHRDLKPENILVLPEGEIMLLDLGVARPLCRGVVGTAIGTPGYAPPEQYQGLADERSDLYALGATMHFMLTGYDAEQAAPFRHPPVRQIRPNISAETEQIVTALLQLAPEQRPAGAGAVIDMLARIDESSLAAAKSLYARILLVYAGGVVSQIGIAGVALTAAWWNRMQIRDIPLLIVPLLLISVIPFAFTLMYLRSRDAERQARKDVVVRQARQQIWRMLCGGILLELVVVCMVPPTLAALAWLLPALPLLLGWMASGAMVKGRRSAVEALELMP